MFRLPALALVAVALTTAGCRTAPVEPDPDRLRISADDARLTTTSASTPAEAATVLAGLADAEGRPLTEAVLAHRATSLEVHDRDGRWTHTVDLDPSIAVGVHAGVVSLSTTTDAGTLTSRVRMTTSGPELFAEPYDHVVRTTAGRAGVATTATSATVTELEGERVVFEESGTAATLSLDGLYLTVHGGPRHHVGYDIHRDETIPLRSSRERLVGRGPDDQPLVLVMATGEQLSDGAEHRLVAAGPGGSRAPVLGLGRELITSIAVSPDGRHVAFTGHQPATNHVLSLAPGDVTDVDRTGATFGIGPDCTADMRVLGWLDHNVGFMAGRDPGCSEDHHIARWSVEPGPDARRAASLEGLSSDVWEPSGATAYRGIWTWTTPWPRWSDR